MSIIKSFVEKHPDLFSYLPAESLNPQDHIVTRVFLRFIPQKITPNFITTVRVIMTPVVFLLVLFGYYISGSILFILVAFTDVLDGSLARTQNKITKFGMMFDPLADKFLIGSMVLLLVFRYLHWLLGVATLGFEIAFICAAFVFKYKFKTVKMANLWGKLKMDVQVLAVFSILLALVLDYPVFFSIATWLFGLSIGFATISLFKSGI